MFKLLFGVALITVLLLITVYVFWPSEVINVCFEKVCFKASTAINTFQWQRGLMFRKDLGADKGLLFIFSQAGDYPFWMKNTLVPLDIIWLNSQKEVVFIQSDAPPCLKDPCPVFSAGQPSLYVLEINALEASKNDIKIGDRADFRY
jgi:hypothetical protein